jgi:hypothetical protein
LFVETCKKGEKMEVEVFTLCDAAADYQGRLSILGVFDRIFATTLPATHAQCSVAVRIRFKKVEAGNHNLTLHIIDYDGNMVIPPLTGQFQIQLPDKEPQGAINLVLNLQGLIFKSYGKYDVNLAIDGREIGSIPFSVSKPI